MDKINNTATNFSESGTNGEKPCRVCKNKDQLQGYLLMMKKYSKAKAVATFDDTDLEAESEILKSDMNSNQSDQNGDTNSSKSYSNPDSDTYYTDNHKNETEQFNCPLDADQLGRATWSYLHTMAAYYPESPSDATREDMRTFVNLFAKFYPCDPCAWHLRERLKTTQPDTTDNKSLSRWFCYEHNEVNRRLGKPLFDCARVLEQWKDGWEDGSCD